MNEEAAKKVLDELIPALEALDTQCTAVLRVLQEKKVVSQKQLASYLEEAGNASNVRWLATRLRVERLLSAITTDGQKAAEPSVSTPPKQEPEERSKATKEASAKEKGDQQPEKDSKQKAEPAENKEKQEKTESMEASTVRDGAADKSAKEADAKEGQGKDASRVNKPHEPSKHEETEAA